MPTPTQFVTVVEQSAGLREKNNDKKLGASPSQPLQRAGGLVGERPIRSMKTSSELAFAPL